MRQFNLEQQRNALSDELQDEGIADANVLHAIRTIPREMFLPDDLADRAYENCALPIAENQTISQPYIVAVMTEALQLQGDETILEIGTGSGYQAAILSMLCQQVVTIERHAALSQQAENVISQLGIKNVSFHVGDGTLGYLAGAPYSGIIVTAAAPDVPNSYDQQLAIGGRLVIPVGDQQSQELIVRTRTENGFQNELICGCRFVKLIGEEGWSE